MELKVAVRKSFGSFTLDCEFNSDDKRLGVFGPSGSGKSTLVSIIAGLTMPDQGSIMLDGECLYDSNRSVNVPPEKRRIAVVFQNPHLFPHLSVKKNLLYGYKRCSPENRKIGLDTLVDVLGINNLLSQKTGTLSGGEKQRVSLGRAVLSNPRLLLMDEPLSSLDDELKYRIIPYLNKVCEKFSVPYMFISHSLIEMRLMTDRVVVLEKGRFDGLTTADALARKRMGDSQTGYINLLKLRYQCEHHGLTVYTWGDNRLFVSSSRIDENAVFELSSRDIILLKRHPEAISARNLLKCVVKSIFSSGNKAGIELECRDESLIAEIVTESAIELEIKEGQTIYAAIKASAFRQLL